MVRYIICLLCLLFVLRSQAQDSSKTHILTKKANSQERQYKKLLIAGFGKPAIRFFLENLSPQLIEHYKNQGVSCVYEYLGNEEKQIKTKLGAAIHQHQVDATLIIYQAFDQVDTLKQKSPYGWNPDPGFLTPNVNWGLEQKYVGVVKIKRITENIRLALLDPKETDPIWQGDLFLVGERIKDKLYAKISFLVTEELFRNKIPAAGIY